MQLIAYIDKRLYQELYAISKVQLAQKNYAKWNDYEVKIDQSLLQRIKEFMPIDGENKANAKSFRLTKNGRETGVFQIKEGRNNVHNLQEPQEEQIREENQ